MAGPTTFVYRDQTREQYGPAWASLYRALRIPDPSFARSREPDLRKKLYRESSIAHALNFRHLSIAGDDFIVAPRFDGELAQRRAKIEDAGLRYLKQFQAARKNLASGDLDGARYAIIVSRLMRLPLGDGVSRDWVIPIRLEDLPKDMFRKTVTRGDDGAESIQIEAYSRKANNWREVKYPELIVKHVVGDTHEMLGWGTGLQEALFLPWYLKTNLLASMSEAADRYGQGQMGIKLDSTAMGKSGEANTKIVTDTIKAAQKMRKAGIWVSHGNDEWANLEGSSTGWQMMESLLRILDQYIDRLILGATLPTGGGDQAVGSLARAEVEDQSSKVLFGAARRALDETLSDDLLGYFGRANHLNFAALGLAGVPNGMFQATTDQAVDVQKNAAVIETLLRAGVKLKAEEVYESVEFTEPTDNDRTIEGQPAPAPGSFPTIGAA